MAADEMWMRKYRKNILQATGNGDISHISAKGFEDDISNRQLPTWLCTEPAIPMYSGGSIECVEMSPLIFKQLSIKDLWHESSSSITQNLLDIERINELRSIACQYPANNIEYEEKKPPTKENGLLLKAVWDDDMANLESAYDEGANVNATCYENQVSAIHIAALRSENALKFLLDHAEKKRVDDLRRTPLHYAAWAGNVNAIDLLINSFRDQRNKEISDFNDKNALYNASNTKNGLKSIPEEWYDDLTHSCPTNEIPPIEKGWTPLHAAVSNGQLEAVNYLLSKGANPMELDKTGFTPLDVIVSSWQSDDINEANFKELIEVLIKSGAVFTSSPKIRDKFNSPLHTALRLKNLDMLRILLENGAPIDCTDESGNTLIHICVMEKLDKYLQVLTDPDTADFNLLSNMINANNKKGENVLHIALKIKWQPGVDIGINYGADVASQTNEGDTAIHLAAEIGNIDTLNKILSDSKANEALNLMNLKGETAFCRAVLYGHMACVKRLFKAGADIEISGHNFTPVHIAAKHGYVEILDFLLKTGQCTEMNTWRTTTKYEGFTPLHFAASYNHPDCLRLLINAGADVLAKSSHAPYDSCTPLHEAVVKNNIEVLQILLEADRSTITQVDRFGWTPLHSASFFGSREAISILLKNGSDITINTLGPNNYKVSSIELIMNNLSKPTEFLEEIFDYCISSNDNNFEAPTCLITIDYRILSPDESLGQSKVIKALLATGNRFGQKRLLVHPLVESFVYLKWKSLLPLIYVIASLWSLFILSLNIFIITAFACQDKNSDTTSCKKEDFWQYFVYVTSSILFLIEILGLKFKLTYVCQLQYLIKFITLGLAVVLPSLINYNSNDLNWPRHLATIELLLSWLQMLLIMSKFPKWGYCLQMFGKVSSIVLKVLFTFSFIVIGFSLSFMIQFHSQGPFKDPWAAFTKTMVMMMSEFDYEDMFKTETGMEVKKILFITFLVIGAIVLMNLLVGLAVNDMRILEIHGNMKRIENQVDFLASLDAAMENPIIKFLIPANNYIRKFNLSGAMIKPDKPDWGAYKSIPQKLRNDIFDKIHSKCLKDSATDSKELKSKLEDISTIFDKAFNIVEKVERINIDLQNITTEMKLFKETLSKFDKKLAEK